MREIKFRAWDKINKLFAELNDIVFENGGEIISISTEFMDHGDNPELHAAHLDSVVLMQYTGLKDKNGVEIYEGDCVRAFSNINKISDPHLAPKTEPEYKRRIVIYFDGAFVLSDDGKREYCGVLNHYVGAMAKDLEIVGNIYENPELLEVSE